MKPMKLSLRALDRLGLGVAALLIVYQAIIALRFAVQVPMHDELLNLHAGGFDGHLTRAYLMDFLQEHLVVLTRGVAWLTYTLADSAPAVQVGVNYAFFVGAFALFYQLVRRLQAPGAAMLLGAIALPMPVDVHAWGFQTHFYGSLCLFFAQLNVLRRQDLWLWAAAPLVVLTVFSFGSGVVFAAVTAAVAGLLMRWRPEQRWAYGATAAAALGAVARYLYLLHRVNPHVTAAKSLFDRPQLPAYFVRLLAKPFGWQEHAPAVAGCVIALGLGLSLIALGRASLQQRDTDRLLFAGAVAGLLGACFCIALGRSPYGVAFANDTRNTSYTLFLVPMLWAMQRVLSARRPALLGALAVLLIAPLAPQIDYTAYRALHQRSLAGKRCLWDYYLGENDGCKDLMPWYDPKPYFDRAWKLDMAFVQEFKQMNAGRPTRYDKAAAQGQASL